MSSSTATASNDPAPAKVQQAVPDKSNTSKKYHVVRSGENLSLIAKKYGCSTTDLKKWNNLRSNTIYPKQKLLVGYEEVSVASASSSGSQGDKIIYYTVKKGDTLWDIAQQYKGVSVDELKKLNNLGNSSKLQPGQKLKIAVGG